MPDPLPWESLAGLRGTADRCTCSDAQLAHVGCDCDAQQNLPVQCDCGRFLRCQDEIEARICASCLRDQIAQRNAEDDYDRESVRGDY